MEKNTSRNIVIGILAVLLIGVGVYAYNVNEKNKNADNSGVSPTSTTTGTDTYVPPTIEPGVPVVVTTAQASPSNSTAVVSGKVTPKGAQTTYWYEYGKTEALGTRTSAKVIGSGYVAIPAPEYITGLSANTRYYFRLSAQNRFGTVNGSTYSFTTNNNPPPQATVPSVETRAADSVSRTSVRLNGRVTPNNSDTSYWFEYVETQDLGNLTSFRSVGNGNASVPVSASVSNLKPQTKYYFRVNAQNQYGTVVGATLSFTTQGPGIPSAPTPTTENATNVSQDSAVLQGRLSPNGAETTYWFEYYPESTIVPIAIVKTTPKQTLASDKNTTQVSAKVEGLDPNTKYNFRLIAQNSEGIRYGNVVGFKTSPAS